MKKLLASVLACSMIAGMGVSAFAATGWNDKDDTDDLHYEDIDGTVSGNDTSFEKVRPDSTYWIAFTDLMANHPEFQDKDGNATVKFAGYDDATLNNIDNDDLFKVSFDKDGDGKSLIKSITVVDDKKVDDYNNGARTSFLKVVTNQTFDDSEKKAKIEVTVKPKKSVDDVTTDTKYYQHILDAVSGNKKVSTSDEIVMNLTFWIQNAKETGDSVDVVEGQAFVFDPQDNEENTIVYGDDRAALYFDADDDADKFYAKLSTKSMSDIYSEYGDPADADLWFYDWTGNKTIPSTSRATLTLGIPWDDDDDYVPNPEDCYIYALNADGTLEDVTGKFTYDTDNDATTGIEGWTIKTRTLGTYVLSDTELDVGEEEVEEPASSTAPVESSSAPATDAGNKGIPNTGSSDMVNVAVMAAVLSLAAAGAIAFKKASK